MGILGFLTLAFVVLKLCSVIAWSWLWVLSPIWISFVLWLGFVLTALFISWLINALRLK